MSESLDTLLERLAEKQYLLYLTQISKTQWSALLLSQTASRVFGRGYAKGETAVAAIELAERDVDTRDAGKSIVYSTPSIRNLAVPKLRRTRLEDL